MFFAMLRFTRPSAASALAAFGICLLPVAAWAQAKTFVFVGAGYQQPPTNGFIERIEFPTSAGTGRVTSDYDITGGLAIDVSAGYRVTSMAGFGVGFTRFASSAPASVALSLPPATANAPTADTLGHTETSIHLNAYFMPPMNFPYEFMVFGGATRTSVSRDLVNDVVYTSNPLHIIDLPTEQSSNSGWGFNVGIHAGYFFTRSQRLAVGGTVRYTRASIDVANPLRSIVTGTSVTSPLTSGGFVLTGGLCFEIRRP